MTWMFAPAAAALWGLTLSRLLIRSTSRAQRVMTATVSCLAVVVTLQVPLIREGVLATWGERVLIIGDHLAAIAVEMLILLFVREIQGQGVTSRAIVGITAAVAAVTTGLLLLVGPTNEAMTYGVSAATYPSAWPWLTYWSITIAFGFWAFGAGARFYWRYPRQAGARGEALGIMLLGVGTTIALVVTMLRAGVVISAPVRQMQVWDGWATRVALVLVVVLLVAIVGGLMARAAASWVAQYATWRYHRRSVAAVEPLWRTLTTAVPNLTLDHRAMVSLMGARLSQRDTLYRRVIEINDGLLALGPYTSATVRDEALEEALAAGELPDRAHLVADTVAVHIALERYRSRSRAAQASAHLVTRQAGDFSAEVRRLSEIARASCDCPLTAEITQRMREKESA